MKDPNQAQPVQALKSKKHYDVSIGIIWRDKKLLIAQRQADDVFGGFWEFPGGKRAAGESLEESLVREINEEMDFEIQVGKLMSRLEQENKQVSFTFYVYECQYLNGTPKTIECDDFKWITPNQLSNFHFTSVDQQIIKDFF